MHQQTITVDPEKMLRAARRLSNEGIWVRRDFWADENGFEVAADDPSACNREYIYEVDYDRIVALVVEHLITATSTQIVAPSALEHPAETKAS